MRKVVSLFTGAGGLDLGLEAAGFETAVAVEMDPHAVKTLRHNRPWPVIDQNIHEVTSEELLDAAGAQRGDIDLLVGGPPCQPFSKSGYWANGDAKRLSDPRATTLEAYLRVLKDVQPKAFLIENVAGLAYKRKNEGLELLQGTIRSINAHIGTSYSFHMALLNAADFGVPQERERVFIVGHREGLPFEFPVPTHERLDRGSAHEPTRPEPAQPGLFRSTLLPAATAWDALGDLQEEDDPTLKVTGKWAELLPSIPEGCNYLYHTDRGEGRSLFGWRRRYWSFLLKLSKHYPSWTITAQPGSAIGPFHWKNRRLSTRELCRLQTFPDDYEIMGGKTAAQKQLGNAVPAALTELLGLEMRRQLFGEPELSRPLKLLPQHKSLVPEPEEVLPVAPKYLERLGQHTAHPGTGKGRGALARSGTSA